MHSRGHLRPGQHCSSSRSFSIPLRDLLYVRLGARVGRPKGTRLATSCVREKWSKMNSRVYWSKSFVFLLYEGSFFSLLYLPASTSWKNCLLVCKQSSVCRRQHPTLPFQWPCSADSQTTWRVPVVKWLVSVYANVTPGKGEILLPGIGQEWCCIIMIKGVLVSLVSSNDSVEYYATPEDGTTSTTTHRSVSRPGKFRLWQKNAWLSKWNKAENSLQPEDDK